MPRKQRLRNQHPPQHDLAGSRRLDIETLEDRRLLAILTVNTFSDDTVAGDQLVTLREAVAAANDDAATDLGQTGSGADQIVFDPDLFTAGAGMSTLVSGAISITSDLEILGPGADLLTISGNNAARIFTIDDGDGGETNASVRLADLTLTDGLATGADDAGRGGAIFSVESLTIERLVIQNSVAGNDGGALVASVADDGQIRIQDSTITGNVSATGIGGGLSVLVLYGAQAYLSNLDVEGNDADVAGGGVALTAAYDGAITLADSRLVNNIAKYGGGAVVDAIELGAVAIERTTISGNTALGEEEIYDRLGGGISIYTSYRGTASLLQSTISGNAGGGVAAVNGYQGTLYLLEANIVDNLGIGPNNYGGGGMQVVADELSTTELVRSQISGHDSRGEQGALGIISGAGGGLYLYGYRTNTTIRDSTIAGNQSTGSGGGLYLAGYGSGLEIVGSTISGNQADRSGGGLYLYHDPSSALVLAHSTVTGNQADRTNTGLGDGGGLLVYGAAPLLDHVILAGNAAHSGFGPDLYGPATLDYTLLGNNADSWLTIVGSGNQIGTSATPIDPLLAPLGDNGGPTLTHALLAASSAVDLGDPSILSPPIYDQRTFPYQRIAGAAIDLGAYERQDQPADFDNDLRVAGNDFLAWQRGYGALGGAAKADGDADLDGDVDGLDLLAWEATFGVGDSFVVLQNFVALQTAEPESRAASVANHSTDTQHAEMPSMFTAPEMLSLTARDEALRQLTKSETNDEADIVVRRPSVTSTLRHQWRVL